jgi:hypothetical protein
MIRYVIETSQASVILDATLVQKMVTTFARKAPIVIVYVNGSDKKAFEKSIEGNPKVLKYRADPRATDVTVADWERK